jgi:hydrogenase maturation protease
MNTRILIIGFGNIYCRDDGVGFYIVNALRRRMGLPELGPDEDGMDDLDHGFDTLLLHQLVPEVSQILANYQNVLFVDAHTGSIQEDVRIIPVQEEYGFHAVTHQMSPGMLLATTRKVHGSAPTGYLVSIKGESFDFQFGLSDGCRARADRAVQKILDLANEISGKDEETKLCG